MKHDLVSVIVPNWNGAHLLRSSIGQLLCQTHTNIEIIVADGNSKDSSRPWLENVCKLEPRVRLLALAKNYGFVGNVNRALAQTHGSYIALVNNDVELEPTWLEEIMMVAESASEHIGMFACKTLQSPGNPGKRVILSAGDYVQTNGFADSRGVRMCDLGQFDRVEEVFSPSGSACVYRKDLVNDIGHLEEEFTSYLEDVQLGFRAHLRGWHCLYVPAARAYHQVGQTASPERAAYYIARNTIWMVFLCFPDGLLRKYWVHVLIAQLRLARRAYRLGHESVNRERLRGMLHGLNQLRSLAPKRREIQSRICEGGREDLDNWLRWGDEQMRIRVTYDSEWLPLHVSHQDLDEPEFTVDTDHSTAIPYGS